MGHATNAVEVAMAVLDEPPFPGDPPTAIVGGRKHRAAVQRAAAGLTMAIGAIAFSLAYFDRKVIPLRIVACLFLWSSSSG